jgi:sec-independent protein translocase protein TatA
MSIGIWQVVLILLIVLIIFGAGKLPKVMGDVAKGIKNFKTGLKDDDDDAAADHGKVVHTPAASAPVTPAAMTPTPVVPETGHPTVHAAPQAVTSPVVQPVTHATSTGAPTVDHTVTVKKDETANT